MVLCGVDGVRGHVTDECSPLAWIIHEPSLESAGGRRTRRRKENALTTLVTNVNSYVVYTAVEQKNSRS